MNPSQGEWIPHRIATADSKGSFHHQHNVSQGDVFSSEFLANIELPSCNGIFLLGKNLGINVAEGCRVQQQPQPRGHGGSHSAGMYSGGSMLSPASRLESWRSSQSL